MTDLHRFSGRRIGGFLLGACFLLTGFSAAPAQEFLPVQELIPVQEFMPVQDPGPVSVQDQAAALAAARAEALGQILRREAEVLAQTIPVYRETVATELEALRARKKAQVTGFLQDFQQDLAALRDDPVTPEALAAFSAGDGFGSPGWRAAANRYSAHFFRFLEQRKNYDLFLIDPEGTVVFSVAQEAEFGTNLETGPFARSGLADAYRAARSKAPLAFSGYKPLLPNYGEPVAMLAAPVIGETGQVLGVVALQMATQMLSALVQEPAGGQGLVAAEVYLVGPDRLPRSDSGYGRSVRAAFANPEIGQVNSRAVTQALAGQTGVRTVYHETDALLSAYAPLEVWGRTWALMVETDLGEALDRIQGFEGHLAKNGHEDLFLIAPNGTVFFSVYREQDYKTNLIEGPYADSGLGRVARAVLESGRAALSDVAPYGPRQGALAAFAAAPVFSADNALEMVVGLQLSSNVVATLAPGG